MVKVECHPFETSCMKDHLTVLTAPVPPAAPKRPSHIWEHGQQFEPKDPRAQIVPITYANGEPSKMTPIAVEKAPKDKSERKAPEQLPSDSHSESMKEKKFYIKPSKMHFDGQFSVSFLPMPTWYTVAPTTVSQSAELSMTNKMDRCMTFKIKCTRKERFKIEPIYGYVEPQVRTALLILYFTRTLQNTADIKIECRPIGKDDGFLEDFIVVMYAPAPSHPPKHAADVWQHQQPLEPRVRYQSINNQLKLIDNLQRPTRHDIAVHYDKDKEKMGKSKEKKSELPKSDMPAMSEKTDKSDLEAKVAAASVDLQANVQAFVAYVADVEESDLVDVETATKLLRAINERTGAAMSVDVFAKKIEASEHGGVSTKDGEKKSKLPKFLQKLSKK